MTLLTLFAFVVSIVVWASSTVQDAYYGLAHAGLLHRGTFRKVAIPAVLLTTFAFLFAPVSFSIPAYVLALATVASLSNVLYVMTMAGVYGVSLELAAAVWHKFQLDQSVNPIQGITDKIQLQAYLDRTYGRGLVDANMVLAQQRAKAA